MRTAMALRRAVRTACALFAGWGPGVRRRGGSPYRSSFQNRRRVVAEVK